MKKDVGFYIKLFTSTFYLSAFTFGGGYVIIPLMRKKFVNEYHWIEEEEMLDLVAIAQSTPGALAVNAAILVGYRLAGFLEVWLRFLGQYYLHSSFYLLYLLHIQHLLIIQS